MDVLAVTDFPDIRTKCAIQSHDGGSILLIPREGGHLFRMYVDLGEVAAGRPRRGAQDHRSSRSSRKANEILHPYTLDVKQRRLAQRLRGRPPPHRPVRRRPARGARHPHAARLHHRRRLPHAQRQGRPGHERVDAGRLQPRLEARPRARRAAARRACWPPTPPSARWSRRTSSTSTRSGRRSWRRSPRSSTDPAELEDFYVRTAEFPAGFMTAVPAVDDRRPSRRTRTLATGFPIGKRFKSAPRRRGSATPTPCTSATTPRADGRWRIYVVRRRGGGRRAVAARRLGRVAGRLAGLAGRAPRPTGADVDAVVRRQGRSTSSDHTDVDIARGARGVPARRSARSGSSTTRRSTPPTRTTDIFELRGIDRGGVVVVVRPDQYVAHVLPLTATAELAAFFAPLLRAGRPAAV